MAVENVEKLCPKVNGCVFAEETGFLAQCEILVPASESPSTRERAGFVAKGERGRDCKCVGIPEGSRGGVEVRTFVRLGYSGNDVYSGDPSEVAPGE